MNPLFALAIVTLLLPIKTVVGPAQLRPFDVLVALIAVGLVIQSRKYRLASPPGLILLSGFLAWHMLSALTLGSGNALREGLQVGVVALFALCFVAAAPHLNVRAFGRWLGYGLGGVMAYNVGWHLANGFPTGWKRLNDPKAAFTFLPMALGPFLVLSDARKRQLLWGLWIVLGLVILFSGERKALIAYGVTTLFIVSQARFQILVPALLAGFLALQLLTVVVQDPYLQRQLQTIVGGGEVQAFEVDGMLVETVSNAQRKFAFLVATEQIAQHPVFGVGTNGFEHVIRTEYGAYPAFLRLSFHGEFVRVLVENGAIGFVLYTLIWIVGVIRARRALHAGVPSGALTRAQADILLVALYLPLLMYVSFEAAGTRAFMCLTLGSLIPDLVPHALGKRASVNATPRVRSVAGSWRRRDERSAQSGPRPL